MDSSEFGVKVLPLQISMYRLAMSVLKNREEAEDVVQEIFYRLWKIRSSLIELQNLKAYALKITKNLCLDRIKLRKQVTGEIEKMHLRSSQQTPHQKLETSNLLEIIQSIIATLPEQQQLIVHLRSVEGLSMEEISEVTEMSINSIRVSLSRARKSINEIYQLRFNHG
ncbi:MAG: RNA polymerase sigma factor [Flammeovirgaceae bacterium]